jgi:hypothetical protein
LHISEGFDTLLHLENSKVISVEDEELVVEYEFPEALALNSDSDSLNGKIGIGAVMAVADVFTTLILILKDPDHRPG